MRFVVQQRLWEHLDLTMRAAQHAEKVLRTTNVNDDDAVDGMSALIDEVARKHDGVRNEMASHGVTVPIAPTTDISQSLGGGQGGRRMAFERQIGDIKEACVQVRLLFGTHVQLCCKTVRCPPSHSVIIPRIRQRPLPAFSSMHLCCFWHQRQRQAGNAGLSRTPPIQTTVSVQRRKMAVPHATSASGMLSQAIADSLN